VKKADLLHLVQRKVLPLEEAHQDVAEVQEEVLHQEGVQEDLENSYRQDEY
jgi:hypothetical protein